jgi:hypothetical protein
MAKAKWTSPVALWNWGLGDTRKKMSAEATRKLMPPPQPTIASVIYPHLPSAQAVPPKKQERKG